MQDKIEMFILIFLFQEFFKKRNSILIEKKTGFFWSFFATCLPLTFHRSYFYDYKTCKKKYSNELFSVHYFFLISTIEYTSMTSYLINLRFEWKRESKRRWNLKFSYKNSSRSANPLLLSNASSQTKMKIQT